MYGEHHAQLWRLGALPRHKIYCVGSTSPFFARMHSCNIFVAWRALGSFLTAWCSPKHQFFCMGSAMCPLDPMAFFCTIKCWVGEHHTNFWLLSAPHATFLWRREHHVRVLMGMFVKIKKKPQVAVHHTQRRPGTQCGKPPCKVFKLKKGGTLTWIFGSLGLPDLFFWGGCLLMGFSHHLIYQNRCYSWNCLKNPSPKHLRWYHPISSPCNPRWPSHFIVLFYVEPMFGLVYYKHGIR